MNSSTPRQASQPGALLKLCFLIIVAAVRPHGEVSRSSEVYHCFSSCFSTRKPSLTSSMRQSRCLITGLQRSQQRNGVVRNTHSESDGHCDNRIPVMLI